MPIESPSPSPLTTQTDRSGRAHFTTNAGGLIVWPARLMVPVGFFLLVMQGISELIKRIAFLRGLIPDPTEKHEGTTAEQELAEAIRKQHEQTT